VEKIKEESIHFISTTEDENDFLDFVDSLKSCSTADEVKSKAGRKEGK
jgi:hypothetical protein